MLSVRNITNDLGVLNVTVWRWIREGKIKATMVNRRIGWRIKDEEYARFLEENPRYQMVHWFTRGNCTQEVKYKPEKTRS